MSRRGENIHKRKDGRWEGRVLTEMSDGVKKYISVYGHTYAEAKQKIKDKRRQPCLSSVSNSKFESVAMQWLFSLKASIKGATETKYYFLLKNHILPFFSQFYLNDITKSDLLIFMNEKLLSGKKDGSGGLSVTYVKEIMTVIFLILQYAFDQDILAVAPPKIKLPQIPKTEIKVFTINEQKKYETVLNCSTNLFNLGILIAFYSGLRLGELCALKWENVDMKEKIIHVRSTVSRVKSKESDETVLIIDSPKTQCSLRDIPMSKYLFSLFENALAKQPVTLVPTDDGGALKSISVSLVDKNGKTAKELLNLSGEKFISALENGNGQLTFEVPEGLYQNVRIVCDDEADFGNEENIIYDETIENVSVATSSFLIFWANKPLRWGSIGGVLIVTASAAAFVFMRKRKLKYTK